MAGERYTDVRFTRVDAERQDTAREGTYDRERFAYEVPFPAPTVHDEHTNRGWASTAKPTGASEPAPLRTAGHRGAQDIS